MAETPDHWLTERLPLHEGLTKATVSIMEGLLNAKQIEYLSVQGRTKTVPSIRSKIVRKGYSDPQTQLTDISGIRIVVFLENQVNSVCEIIEKTFNIDKVNSHNKTSNSPVDKIGYRSIHYVADLGEVRTSLPEYSGISDLKFEIQVRTVLQHAWAELAHDRNYKFSSKLPRHIERELFLYAGLLEIADLGFNKIAEQIDTYKNQVREKTNSGNLDIELNSISLKEFLSSWKKESGVTVEEGPRSSYDELVNELSLFGVDTLKELQAIIPENYEKAAKDLSYSTTPYGLLRDWMLMFDHHRYRDHGWNGWKGVGGSSERELYSKVIGSQRTEDIFNLYGENEEIQYWDDDEY